MKKLVSILALLAVFFVSCSKDDTPITEEVVNSVDVTSSVTPECFQHGICASYLYLAPIWSQSLPKAAQEIISKDIFSFKFTTPKAGIITFKTHASPLNEEYTETFVMPEKGKEMVIRPNMQWNFNAIRCFDNTGNVNFKFTMYIDDKQVATVGKTILARSINECLLAIPLNKTELEICKDIATKNYIKIDDLLAGYIEETNPLCDIIGQQAIADLAPYGLDTFADYQGGDDYAKAQMAAIWYMMVKKGVTYSNATITPGWGIAQRVRFISQTYAYSQGNCVELTTLFASLFSHYNFNVAYVLVPNHMFLAVLDANNKNILFGLECVMIGYTKYNHNLSIKENWDNCINGFKGAMVSGNEKLDEALAQIDAKNPEYSIHYLNKVRENVPSINYGSLKTDTRGRVMLVPELSK